jgi:hypothetical protein
MHLRLDLAQAVAVVVEMDVGVVGQQGHGDGRVGTRLEIISAVSRWPNGLSWLPACQMLTRPAFHVSTGPTLHARRGTPAT